MLAKAIHMANPKVQGCKVLSTQVIKGRMKEGRREEEGRSRQAGFTITPWLWPFRLYCRVQNTVKVDAGRSRTAINL